MIELAALSANSTIGGLLKVKETTPVTFNLQIIFEII